MQKGFTLIELQAVIILMAIVIIISIPSVVEHLRKSEAKARNLIEYSISEAARSYIVNNPDSFRLIANTNYKLQLQNLIDNGYLSKTVLNSDVGKEYDVDGCITVNIEADKSFAYEFNTICP